MDKSHKTILVTGATGRQGGAVLKHLLANDWKVKALTRSPESGSARYLKGQGLEIVPGDMAKPESLKKVMEGMYGVYSVQNALEYGVTKEIEYGKNMADVAKAAGVEHFVYSSVGEADRKSGVSHFESKFEIENHIRQLDLPATILRPVLFMENYYILQVYKGILNGKLNDPIKPDKKNQLIAADDIGAYAAYAFEHPEKMMGETIEIAGDELTNPEIAEVMSRVLGFKVKFRKLPMLIVRLFLGQEFYQMFKWFNEAGFAADIEGNKGKHPAVQPMNLETWLRREGWDRWNKKGKV